MSVSKENKRESTGFFRAMRKLAVVLGVITLVLIAVIILFSVYVGDYYRADVSAISAFSDQHTVTAEELDDGSILFTPDSARAGLIFYPGGKVDHLAYQPLMQALCERGILCVLIKMPFNLAVLDINAADGIPAQYPDITDWYIGGHSLGGSMAASHLSKNVELYRGLLLLGAYSTADLSDTALPVLSIYGSEDGVMDRESYETNKSNLPKNYIENVIEGGCHAYFGMYGKQEGDGVPTLTAEQQILTAADSVAAFMGVK